MIRSNTCVICVTKFIARKAIFRYIIIGNSLPEAEVTLANPNTIRKMMHEIDLIRIQATDGLANEQMAASILREGPI